MQKQTHEVPPCESAGRESLRRHLTIAAGMVACLAALAGGCSSSGDSTKFAEFVGTWTFESENSTFNLSCPTVSIEAPFTFWDTVAFEPGVLSDLEDVGGPCYFAYNVDGKVASVATPDPYTGLAPTCEIFLSFGSIVLNPSADPAWKFGLFAPEAGQAPRAQMEGTAPVVLNIDADATTGAPASAEPCTFSGAGKFHKIAK